MFSEAFGSLSEGLRRSSRVQKIIDFGFLDGLGNPKIGFWDLPESFRKLFPYTLELPRSILDLPESILELPEVHFGAPGVHFAAPGTQFGFPGDQFWSSGDLPEPSESVSKWIFENK